MVNIPFAHERDPNKFGTYHVMTGPFYITQEGPNVIKPQHIEGFVAANPSLVHYTSNYPIELKLLSLDVFQSFSYWILSQQLSGHVANILIKKFTDALPSVSPEAVLDTPISTMRALGLSQRKSEYLHHLAKFCQNNASDLTKDMSTADALELFTQIKGVGEWTVQMHLIFSCGHLDILPAKDLVVRKGVAKLYGLDEIPTEQATSQICSDWGSLATVGTILSWAVMGE